MNTKDLSYILVVTFFLGCNHASQNETLFELKINKSLGVEFTNQLDYTEQLNTYTYRNFYNGGGVAIGDINNDSLPDIYLTGNLVDNKLYLNKGDWAFEDITEEAGVACENIWSSGVSMADINGDGWLDIYICKSGPPGGLKRHNELFINNKDLTFTEQSGTYGLDDEGLSTHAAFFDFDKDGDLDCYLLNNSLKSVGGFDLIIDQREIRDSLGGNKLYRNDDNFFVDISEEAGIYGSKIGFGLGVTVGDVNGDNWPDIYVSNDYFEKDYLYINDQDGTFSESIEEYTNEISLSSMGADMADLNNDGYPEIFVTDMLPSNERRIKTKTTFDNWDKYKLTESKGYFKQFTRNALQLNNGDGSFSEVSRFSGVFASDWSWGALIFDMDNDGLKDIFVANGIYKDLTDQDYTNFIGDPENVRSILREENKVIKRLVDSIPSEPLLNAAFINNGNMQFTDQAATIGLNKPSFSNGAAYGDLDRDGDLDLVVNNVNMPVFIYENTTYGNKTGANYIQVVLKGKGKNTHALGAKVFAHKDGEVLFQEHMTMRSYMSTTEYKVHFGLGSTQVLDSLVVIWSDDTRTKMIKVSANQVIYVNQNDAALYENRNPEKPETSPILNEITDGTGIDFTHLENEFVDFDRDRLLINMHSNEGPCLCTGDTNNDGVDDIYIGGAKEQNGYLFTSKNGKYSKSLVNQKGEDHISEDTDCIFFDANNDGMLDLYIASGGNEFPSSSSALTDRLYLNKGNENFVRGPQILPAGKFESTSSVKAADFDMDGDLDLFVGIRLKPFHYGIPVNGYILENDGNANFTDVTLQVAPELIEIGLVTDGLWVDIDLDNDQDLIVVGEWMPITIFANENGKLIKNTSKWIEEPLLGLWNTIEASDLDSDGDMDLIVGNLGLNSRIKASKTKPASFYINDFDANGSLDHFICVYNGEHAYPLALRQDLVMQLPSLKSRYLKHKNYAEQTIEDIFSKTQLDQSIKYEVNILESIILRNTENGQLEVEYLPWQAQLSPIYAICTDDYDRDGIVDILLGGNQHKVKPEMGIYDASYGLFLKRGGEQYLPMKSSHSGLHVEGQIRGIRRIEENGFASKIVIARTNERAVVYEY